MPQAIRFAGALCVLWIGTALGAALSSPAAGAESAHPGMAPEVRPYPYRGAASVYSAGAPWGDRTGRPLRLFGGNQPGTSASAGVEPGGWFAVGRSSDPVASFARRYRIRRGLSNEIYQAALAQRLDPELAFSLVRTESGFDPRAVGPTGSIGLTQLQPVTARQLSPGLSEEDLYHPRVNLELGFRYLRMQLDRFRDVSLALAAYNRGPTHVQTLLARGDTPGGAYARRILRNVEGSAHPSL